MCKDEQTYFLRQKCPNTMRLQDHKSAIVNLRETKLSKARIYLSHTSGQIKAEQHDHSLQHIKHIFFLFGLFFLYFSLPKYSKRSCTRPAKFAFRKISVLRLGFLLLVSTMYSALYTFNSGCVCCFVLKLDGSESWTQPCCCYMHHKMALAAECQFFRC